MRPTDSVAPSPSGRSWGPRPSHFAKAALVFGLVAAVVGAAPAGAATAVTPSIRSLSATPSTLKSPGGTVKLVGKVSHASKCKFSASPTITGLPKTVSCSGGTASYSVKFPANKTGTTKKYAVKLTAVSSTGNSTSKSVTVKVLPHAPTVTSITASPTTLPATGGAVKITVHAKLAATCTITSNRSVAGLPVTLRCTSGSASKTVTLPKLTGTTNLVYDFSAKAKNPGGTSTAKTTTSTVYAKPAVSNFTATPPTFSSSGGPVSLSATIANATSCTFAQVSGPSLAGLPATVACTGTSTSQDVTLPANTGTTTADYSFSLAVTGHGGTVNASPDATASVAGISAPSPLTWSQGSAGVELPPERWTSVSCPSATFCAAGSSSAGDVALDTSGAWGAVTTISPGAAISSISCSSSSFCIAAAGATLYVYDGSSWSTASNVPTALSSGVATLSCVPGTTAFCMVMGFGGQTFTTSDGTTWTTASAAPNYLSRYLRCTTSTSCVSIEDTASNVNVAYSWNGTTWTEGGSLGSLFAQSFSCSSATLCLATTYDSSTSSFGMEVYNGTSWSAAPSLPSGAYYNPESPVACAIAGDCFTVVGDTTTQSALADYSASAGTWSLLVGPNIPDSALSCASSSACTLGEDNNQLASYDGTSWSYANVGWGAQVSAVSCASATFCAAVDNLGNITTFNGTSWTTPANVDTHGFRGVSCWAGGSCAALDGIGQVWLYDGTSWSLPTANKLNFTGFPGGIDCTSSSFCAAVLGSHAAVWNGTSWTKSSLDTNGDLSSVSCTISTFCVAVDQSGDAFTYGGASWTSGTLIDANAAGYGGDQFVSCLSSSVCVAGGWDGYAETFNGSAWSSSTLLDNGSSLNGVSCIVSASYCVVSSANDVFYLEDNSGTLSWVSDVGAVTSGGGIDVLGCATSLCVGVGFANEAYYGVPSGGGAAPMVSSVRPSPTSAAPRTAARGVRSWETHVTRGVRIESLR